MATIHFYVIRYTHFALFEQLKAVAKQKNIEMVAVDRMALADLTDADVADLSTREDAEWLFMATGGERQEVECLIDELLEEAQEAYDNEVD